MDNEMEKTESVVDEVNNSKSKELKTEKENYPDNSIFVWIKRFFPSKSKELKTEKENYPDNSIFVWKEIDGTYRWLAIYSNMYRDNDNPPEIISKQSHIRFVNMVDNKEADYPELWHWHIKGTKWGQSDWVMFDEETGFALASGYVLKGHEKEAEMLIGRDDIKVSHGMPVSSIVRDKKDKSVITEHITVEISDLPAWAAANSLTGFQILHKEVDMPIPEAKKEYLKSVGLSDETIDEINKSLAKKAKEASDLNLEFKETELEDSAPTNENEEKESTAENTEDKSDNKSADVDKTKEELAEILASFKLEVDNAIKEIKEEIALIKSQKAEEVNEKSSYEDFTPSMSLASLIATKMRAIGSKEAEVKKKDNLGEPVESPSEKEEYIVNTGNESLDSVFSKIIGGKNG